MPMSADLVRQCALLSAAEHERVAEAESTEIRRLEADGFRIVDGGQDDSPDDNGESDWSVRDWRTGEVLASGHGDHVASGEAVDREESRRGERWYHRDRIWQDTDMPVAACPDFDGLPPSLAQVIFDWVAEGDASEIAGFIGWDVSRVKAWQ
jgi:hypothetical protein